MANLAVCNPSQKSGTNRVGYTSLTVQPFFKIKSLSVSHAVALTAMIRLPNQVCYFLALARDALKTITSFP